MPDDVLALARRLLARGFSVIPIPRPRAGVETGHPGDGKTSVIKWGPYQRRRPTDRELRRWFGGAPMNIAVITGAISGVVVIDADDLAAIRWCVRHLPWTPWQTKTSRGYHLWYRAPDQRVPNKTRLRTSEGRLAIEVRGDGGYVIAPGSLHASGVTYIEGGDWSREIAEVPRFWPGWLQRPTDPPRPRRHTASPCTNAGEVLERARRYLAAIPRPEIGAGSDAATWYAACRLVRGFALTPADAEALLWEWAGGRDGWTHEWIARKVAHAERDGTEPIGGLRDEPA